eukprot:gene6601-13362_t
MSSIRLVCLISCCTLIGGFLNRHGPSRHLSFNVCARFRKSSNLMSSVEGPFKSVKFNETSNSLIKEVDVFGDDASNRPWKPLIPASVNKAALVVALGVQIAIGIIAWILLDLFHLAPLILTNFSLDPITIFGGLLLGLPLFIMEYLMNTTLSKKIIADSMLFNIEMFGIHPPKAEFLFSSIILAISTAMAEETFYRGFWFLVISVLAFPATPMNAMVLALAVTSVMFGVAHFPTAGANVLFEMLAGGYYGLLFILSGGNLAVPIAAHTIHDALVLYRDHERATSTLRRGVIYDVEMTPGLPILISTPQFASLTKTLFNLVDFDGDGFISEKELRVSLRVFRIFLNTDDTRKLFNSMDKNNDGRVDFMEFNTFITESAQFAADTARTANLT